MDGLGFQIQKLKEERLKDQDELYRLRDMTTYRAKENQDLQQRMRAIDYELAKSQERSGDLGKVGDDKEFDLRRTSEALDAALQDAARLKDEQSRQLGEQSQLQRQQERQ